MVSIVREVAENGESVIFKPSENTLGSGRMNEELAGYPMRSAARGRHPNNSKNQMPHSDSRGAELRA